MVKIYLLSVAISFAILMITSYGVALKLKEQGVSRAKSSKGDNILNWLKILVLCGTPILNIVIAIVAVFTTDDIIDKRKQEDITPDENKN